MGGGSSSSASQDVEISIFDYKYQKERADLRKALMSSFLNNPKNKDATEKITIMRKLVTQHPHICATAAREADTAAAPDSMPTSTQAAYRELDRLVALYETSTILKSVQCRIGQVACPLGHYAGYVDKFSDVAPKDSNLAPKCSICDKGVENGYHCGYCEYSLCVPCSTVYCCNGHALKIWTHAESQHSCVVCHKQPITAGYRCTLCEDYDICDYCTWKDGRKVVQQVILDRIADHLAYMDKHSHESETAYKTINSHSKKIAMNAYPTTKHLYDFSISIQDLRATAKAEVRQTRITKAIEKLRQMLCEGKEFSRTALLESMVVECFTMEELTRLRGLAAWYEEQRSVVCRTGQSVGCPLGHVALPYENGPPVYAVPGGLPPSLTEEEVQSTALRGIRPKADMPPNACVCMVCERYALPSGVHCMYCDYSLCSLCSVMYCGRGHRMALWTEPAAVDLSCLLCKKKDLQAGYYCAACNVHLCDGCSSREGRGRIRTDWDQEVRNLMQYMQRHRRQSDIAMFYQWRHTHQVVSLGLLVDYVQELRTAKSQAEKQVAQKPLIDKIKVLRGEICAHPHLCATAARELKTNENFVFPSRKKAAQEVERLAGIVQLMMSLCQPDKRLAAGVACPLGHAMDKLSSAATAHSWPSSQEQITERRRRGGGGAGEGEAGEGTEEVRTREQKDKLQPRSSSPSSSAVSLVSSPVSSPSRLPALTSPSSPSSPFASGALSVQSPTTPLAAAHVATLPAISESSSLSEAAARGEEEEDGEEDGDEGEAYHRVPGLPRSHAKEAHLLQGLKSTQAVTRRNLQDAMNSIAMDFPGSPYYSLSQRRCHVCDRADLTDGRVCSFCEYFLCADCSVVYCRLGHPTKIWTLFDAQSMTCDVCKKAPIISGYRCLTCQTDICDLCTTRESRNAFLLWPKRELQRIVRLLEMQANEAPTARQFLDRLAEQDPAYEHVMSRLCKVLVEAQESYEIAQKEIQSKVVKTKAEKFGVLRCREML